MKRLGAAVGMMLVLSAIADADQGSGALSPGDVSRRFPEPATVSADFPNESEQWMAFKVLYETLSQRAPRPLSQAAYDKTTAYHFGSANVEAKHVSEDRSSAPYRAFWDRNRALMSDRAFRQEVLERYRLTDIPMASPTRPAEGLAPKTAEQLLAPAVPFWLGTIVLMALTINVLVRSSTSPRPAEPPSTNGGVELPETLRVINVPNLNYEVELQSGVVLEEKTWTETHVGTYTTGGEVYTIGDNVFQTPIQRHTSTTTTRKDRIWLRDLSGRESAWTLTGGVLDARAGHLLSRVGGHTADTLSFLLAYNHTTGQFVRFGSPGVHHVNRRRAWRAATLLGSIGFLAGSWGFLPYLGEEFIVGFNAAYIWGLGLVLSAVVAGYLSNRAATKLRIRRDTWFAEKYVPEFKKFFEGITPAVKMRLA